MSNIPISQIVQINPRVVGAGGAQGALDALLMSQSDALPADAPRVFYATADVSAFFGADSPEATAAGVYFAGIIGGGQQPGTLTVARYALAPTAATVFGAPLSLTLPQLQALTGTLIVTTDGGEHVSSAINLTAATSFANAATLMLAGFADPDFSISYDTDRRRFVLTTDQLGPDGTVSAVTGTLAGAVGLSDSAGAYVQAAGVAADTPTTAMDRVVRSTNSFALFTHAWSPGIDQRLDFAEWTAAQDFQFAYVGYDMDAQALTPDNATSFGAMVRDIPLQGTIAVRGTVAHAAAVMAWAASTNYQMTEGRNTLAFREPVAAIGEQVDSLADANALLSNGYTYLGSYASTANRYTVFYNGGIGGQFRWADTYLGQIWVRRSLQQALFETLIAYKSLPYNADGYNAIYQGAQDVISQAVAAGVVRAGVALSASQRAQINAQAGFDIATQVENLGWYLQVADPLTATVRTERGSPVINFWYCDGGSIQKLVVSSTTIL